MRLLIYFLLISSATYSQDSLRFYSVPKWKLDVLLDSYAYDLPSCNNSVVKLDSALHGLKIALTAGQTLIELRTKERDLKVDEVKELRQASIKTESLHKIDLKIQRKKSFKKGIGVGIGAFVIIEGIKLLGWR